MSELESRKGNIVIGVMLVLLGAGLTLDRAGFVDWSGQWSLWPLILGGIGLARLLQSAPGEPKQGLLLLTAAGWLLLGDIGWISLEDSWPIVVIILGLIIALNGGVRRRWHPPVPPVPPVPGAPGDFSHTKRPHRPKGALGGLAVVGVWIAVVAALQVSGVRTFNQSGSDDRVRIFSVMGRGEHISRATAFEGADVTNVMGRSELDLRDATLAPGESAEVRVMSAMGGVIVRVPPAWTVDSGAVSAFGTIRDERIRRPEPEAGAGPAPRIVLRGVVLFGKLTIRS
jgi:hypothetical protein